MAFKQKTKAPRRVWFSNVRLSGHTTVLMDFRYRIEGTQHETYVVQPVEFRLCDMRHLVEMLHANVMSSLRKQLITLSEAMKGER